VRAIRSSRSDSCTRGPAPLPLPLPGTSGGATAAGGAAAAASRLASEAGHHGRLLQLLSASSSFPGPAMMLLPISSLSLPLPPSAAVVLCPGAIFAAAVCELSSPPGEPALPSSAAAAAAAEFSTPAQPESSASALLPGLPGVLFAAAAASSTSLLLTSKPGSAAVPADAADASGALPRSMLLASPSPAKASRRTTLMAGCAAGGCS
jgi:hypothetical protein